MGNRAVNAAYIPGEESPNIFMPNKDNKTQVECKNTSEEIIPGGSALEIVEYDETDDYVCKVKKPTKHNLANFLISPGGEVGIGEYFRATKTGWVKYTGTDVPTLTSTVGTVKDEWTMASGGAGGLVQRVNEEDEYVFILPTIFPGVYAVSTIGDKFVDAKSVNVDGSTNTDIIKFNRYGVGEEE